MALRLAGGIVSVSTLISQPAHANDPWLHLSIAPVVAPLAPAHYAVGVVPVIAPPMRPAVLQASDEMSFQTKESIACLITGGAATAAAIAFGWQNVTNLISGGIVPGAGPGAIALGLFGVVFTSFCAIGQSLAPLYLDWTGQLPPPSPAEPVPQGPTAAAPSIAPVFIRAIAQPALPNANGARNGCDPLLIPNDPRSGTC